MLPTKRQPLPSGWKGKNMENVKIEELIKEIKENHREDYTKIDIDCLCDYDDGCYICDAIAQISDDEKNTINDDFMIKQLKNFIEGFKNQNFCESINIENITSDLKITDDFSFSRKQIKNIQKIIDGNGVFLSENNEQAISLTGKNGFAWLLGMRCY